MSTANDQDWVASIRIREAREKAWRRSFDWATPVDLRLNGKRMQLGAEFTYVEGEDSLQIWSNPENGPDRLVQIVSILDGYRVPGQPDWRRIGTLDFKFVDLPSEDGDRYCATAKQADFLPSKSLVRRLGEPMFLASLGIALAAGALGGYQYTLQRYQEVVTELNFDDPFGAEIFISDRNDVSVSLYAHSNVAESFTINWGDGTQSEPQPIDFDAANDPERLEFRETRSYPDLSAGAGERVTVSVTFQLREEFDVLPETLTDDKLVTTREIWRSPLGLVLDPPSEALTILSPSEGQVTTFPMELQFEDTGFSDPIHIVAVPQDPGSNTLELLGTLRPRALDDSRPRSFLVSKPFRTPTLLVVTSGPERITTLAAPELARVIRAQKTAEITVKPAGVIHSPEPDDEVKRDGTVDLTAYTEDHYAVVAIRPKNAGGFWVQTAPLRVDPLERLSVPVVYGGTPGEDTYEVWVGFTQESALFDLGQQLTALPRRDSADRKVWWLDPVTVRHE